MLDFRTETFLTVCRHMNFTRAAEELNITQPAVSQHIHFLETQYAVKLFVYQGKKIKLTEAGEVFQNAMLTMKHDTIHLKEKMESVHLRKKGIIFGATLTIAEFMLPERLADYLIGHPQETLSMIVANTRELLKKLDEGEIDFAIVEGYFKRENYDYLTYSREPYIAVAKRALKTGISMEQLLDKRLIVRESGSGTREILEKYLAGRNLTISDFKNVTEVGNMGAIKQLLERDCGVAFLYEVAVQQELRQNRLQKVNLTDFNIEREFNFIWRKNSIFKEDYHWIFNMLKGVAI